MEVKTPLTIITGSLGSGKTTLLMHILDNIPFKIAILMNEFGEISIDGKLIKGRNVDMIELTGGCVCCSLIGEFEEAVKEIIETADPEAIVVETTGIAEPDALIFDVQETLKQVRLDGVITIVDADLMVKFPDLGFTTKMQIEDADLLLLNKTDLVNQEELISIEALLRSMNNKAPIIKTTFCQIDPDLLFGLARKKQLSFKAHRHQPEYQSLCIRSQKIFDSSLFQNFVTALDKSVVRAKGFVNFLSGTSLFNFVNGRWEIEPSEKEEDTTLVFIGQNLNKESLIKNLKKCEIGSSE